MDFRHPVEAVIPGVQGRILAVLAETTAELNLRTIARLADVSPAQASRVLPDLVRLGLVQRREAPPSALFALVDDNVAARAVRVLSRSRDAVLDGLGTLAGEMDPIPVSVIVFGSFARGDAEAGSDLDVVLVRHSNVDEDDPAWVSSADAWRTAVRRLTGNPVQVLEVDETEAVRRLRRPTSLWADVIRDGIVVFGSSFGAVGRRHMPRRSRARPVSAVQARAYVSKAEEYLSAAMSELDADRPIAATSLAVHAGINAADAVTGMRLGVRAAGQDHDEVLVLLRTAGPDGVAVAKELARLLPMKTRAEYDPDDVPRSDARRAVERASRIVEIARRVAAGQRSG